MNKIKFIKTLLFISFFIIITFSLVSCYTITSSNTSLNSTQNIRVFDINLTRDIEYLDSVNGEILTVDPLKVTYVWLIFDSESRIIQQLTNRAINEARRLGANAIVILDASESELAYYDAANNNRPVFRRVMYFFPILIH